MIMHVQISSFPILLCMVLTHFLFQPLLYRELYSFLFRLFAEIFICSCSWYCPLLLISLYQFHIISSCKHSHLSYFNNVCAQFAQLSIEPQINHHLLSHCASTKTYRHTNNSSKCGHRRHANYSLLSINEDTSKTILSMHQRRYKKEQPAAVLTSQIIFSNQASSLQTHSFFIYSGEIFAFCIESIHWTISESFLSFHYSIDYS